MKPKKCISVEQARELQNHWVRSRGKEIERGQGYQDTREFWFSLDELQEYINYVREESEKQKVVNPGIRVYFGAYPPGKNNREKSYSTIFLAPTKDVTNSPTTTENNYDIEPLNESSGGVPPTTY
ncbi:hypothetical protein C7S20_17890 [Christiangramia fulva]|uniref:Uncharacterized protein n=1 Tax=Christiangramia fulva TaxID=2126553 RepID=A0A2R3Z9W3_9FLAO|nr:hypothetical protein [Christiangramia fulva]AVR46974.1 hypothetical protein C7S20_17890 [Christiangramia fulva]